MKSKKGIYKMEFDCGRMGSLEGVFIATDIEVKDLIDSGREIYFGEVLGKHSEVCGSIDQNEITLITEESLVIDVIEKYGLTSGYNPFDYIEE